MFGCSNMSWQKQNPSKARQTSLEADLALCFLAIGDVAGGMESLATEWGRESSLGVEIGERGDVGESGNSVGYFLAVLWE